MPTDGRHLLLRWLLALAGWLLCAASLAMPAFNNFKHLWEIYPNTLRIITRYGGRLLDAPVFMSVPVFCFALATWIMAISPILMLLNHSVRSAVRRWRWLALGLPAAVGLSALVIVNGNPSSMPAHLLVLAHLLVCAGILPWPGETLPPNRAFEVILPAQAPRTDTASKSGER